MIIIDNREKRSEVPSILQNLGVEVSFRNLAVGDYLISNEEFSLSCERKSMDDFVQSIQDSRLNNELYNMSLLFPVSILIVEGSFIPQLHNVPRTVYIGALSSAILKRAESGWKGVINVVNTLSVHDTALLLKLLHDRIQEGGEKLIRIPRLPPHSKKLKNLLPLYNLSSIPGVGVEKARKILEHFHTIERVVNAGIEELMKVEGIGRKLANEIYNFFRTEYNVNEDKEIKEV